MALDDRVQQALDGLVRAGFEDAERVVEILCEELYAPGELDPDEVEAAVAAAFARREAEMATWPAVTDCDRLDAVFEALNARGIIALQNAGYTQSDGYSDFRDALEKDPAPERIVGYCFYHGQDLEGAVAGDGLCLAFGPTHPAKEDTRGPEVGRMVVEELGKAGFEVEWDGTFGQRIRVPRIDWKRRGTSSSR